jgi:hypothetical protein
MMERNETEEQLCGSSTLTTLFRFPIGRPMQSSQAASNKLTGGIHAGPEGKCEGNRHTQTEDNGHFPSVLCVHG